MSTPITNSEQESRVNVLALIASIAICQLIMIAAVIMTATDLTGVALG